MKEHPVSRIMYPESRTTHPVSRSPENVCLNGAILGLSKQEIDARFEEIVDFAEIGEFVMRRDSGMLVCCLYVFADATRFLVGLCCVLDEIRFDKDK